MTHSDTGSADQQADSANPCYELLSDTELTHCLCTQDEKAEPAALELRRRHLSAVLAYARGYTTHQLAGNRLATEAFARTVEELRSGVDPLGTWRHHALTRVVRTALVWATDDRQEWLQTEFLMWARTAERPLTANASALGAASYGAPDVILRAFYQLPEQSRGVLWYSVVDEEPDDSVARYLGIRPDTVPSLRGKARLALQDAYVKEYLASRGTAECQRFGHTIETASHTETARPHPALVAHLAGCAPCAHLLDTLTKLSGEPQTTLAAGLLMWGGATYAASGSARPHSEPRPPTHARPGAPGERSASSAMPGDAEQTPAGRRRGSRPAHRSAPKHRTLTAALALSAVAVGAVAVGATMAANAVLGHGQPTAGDSPHRQPSIAPASTSRAQPSTQIRVGVTAQLVHSDTGLCLDLKNGKVQKHTDAVATACTSAPTQRWTLDSRGRLHNAADPDFCLKADGDAAGIGIRPCDSDNPEKRSRMLFIIGRDGVIRSQPRPNEAVVPVGTFTGEPLILALKERTPGHAQAWAARPVPAT
ncbi:ricin-type beta-trefoil lectin domain protein [Streptomyces sp. MUM 16J]|uniref:ricin-type beta-trefoil lectin domain protein n=1 Tax=Streptomyces sp. MUM 16J TaxID=2791988 RepID=UPI001F037C3C|nr:ricin-type beta-trefoil lectin domain protein [Streptomyces sp. MUM 16J]MCH0561294.1 ricin-type beta-trefoil lectin domain protein [Streptomyces sp. MUM 16J]